MRGRRRLGASLERFRAQLRARPSVVTAPGVAKTVLVLPHADLAIDGTIDIAGERLELAGAAEVRLTCGARSTQRSWAWIHCNDFTTPEGEPVAGAFIDGVSVIVPRFGRDASPSTPVVGRIEGRTSSSTSPLRVIANPSTFALTGWRFEAVDGTRKLIGEVDAEREQLAGVTYHDPDGELAYCYNSETASMRVHRLRTRTTGGRMGAPEHARRQRPRALRIRAENPRARPGAADAVSVRRAVLRQRRASRDRPAWARALFTTRRGGCSGGAYESLNLGRWTDDEPAAVEHNRESLQRDLGVRFAYGRQVHGARVTARRRVPSSDRVAPEEADGQATAAQRCRADGPDRRLPADRDRRRRRRGDAACGLARARGGGRGGGRRRRARARGERAAERGDRSRCGTVLL